MPEVAALRALPVDGFAGGKQSPRKQPSRTLLLSVSRGIARSKHCLPYYSTLPHIHTSPQHKSGPRLGTHVDAPHGALPPHVGLSPASLGRRRVHLSTAFAAARGDPQWILLGPRRSGLWDEACLPPTLGSDEAKLTSGLESGQPW